MRWFYAVGKEKVGPLTEAEIGKLADDGTITDKTLVWTDGTKKWLPFAQAKAAPSTPPPPEQALETAVKKVACSQCNNSFPIDETIQYGGQRICASCKSAFFQKVKEGKNVSTTMTYGGFWIRFGAKFLDGIVTGLCYMVVAFAVGFMVQSDAENPGPLFFLFFVQMAIPAVYTTFFLGKFQATPGKMAAGLIVVSPDGGRISYGRAFGRHLGEFLSSIILGIGYLMAAFDDEKRTLHDRICSTRVIKKR